MNMGLPYQYLLTKYSKGFTEFLGFSQNYPIAYQSTLSYKGT